MSQLNLASSTTANTLWSRLTSGIFGRGALAFLLASAGLSISNFVFHVVISRLIGPAAYGGLGAILGIISLLSVPIAALQLAATQAVIGHGGTESHNLNRLLKRAALAGTGGAVLVVLLARPFDGFLHFSSPMPVVMVAIWMPFAVVGAVLAGSLVGEYRFRPVAFATFVGGGLIRLVLGVFLALVGFGVTGAIVATLGAQIFMTVALAIATRHQVVVREHSASISTSTRDVALSVFALAGLSALTSVDTFLSRHFFAPVLAGQYAAGAIAAHIALFVPTAIVTVAFPHLADGEGVSDASRRAFIQGFKIMVLLGLVVAAVMTLFPSIVVSVLFGSTYGPAVAVIRPLAFESAGLSILTLFIYLHLARRSWTSIVAWVGVVSAAIVISLYHSSMYDVALIMLITTGATLIIASVPAWIALTTAALRRETDTLDGLTLPDVTVDFTLVVPFYNPGPAFGPHVSDCVEVLKASGVTFEILAVSDGSTDRSEQQLLHLDPASVRVMSYGENQGKGAALHLGLTEGRGRYLGFIDSDGDLSANLLAQFVAVIDDDGPDIAYGSKLHPQSKIIYPRVRRLYSIGYRLITRLLFRISVRDTQTGIKVIRRDVLVAVLPRMVEKKFAFDLELFVVAQKLGYNNFVELPVEIGERLTSTISINSVRETLLDTFAIFYRLRILRYYDRSIRNSSHSMGHHDESSSRGTEKDGFVKLTVQSVNDKKLRILLFNWRDIDHPNAGGAEVYTHAVIDHWIDQGHSVTLFCAAIQGRPDNECVGDFSIIRRGSRYSVYREARRYYRSEGRGHYDLVVDEINTRPFLTPKWVDDTPVVALVHQVCRELWFYQMPLPLAWIGRYVLEPKWLKKYRTTNVVTISESSKESLLQYGVRNVNVIPEGVDFTYVEVSPPRELYPTVVFVGRLESHKRPAEAIQAFTYLRREYPQSIMWIIGSGPMESELRALSPSGVRFLGKLTEEAKMNRLQRAHVLVATSVREGWGLVVTEAATVGTPTIAYDVPGLRDSVTASGGLLTSPNPDALGRELCKYFAKVAADGVPKISAGGVTSWKSVADDILSVALGPSFRTSRVPNSPPTQR